MLDTLQFPEKLRGKIFRDKEEYYVMCKHLQGYVVNLLYVLNNFTAATQAAMCAFLEVKQLMLSGNHRQLRRAESVPNAFVALKSEFNALLVAKEDPRGNATPASSAMMEFRRIWGIEMTVKVFDAYALLQRMATVLGWTLEINHFFISMFGNTLAFSKLPLRDIIFLQRDIMSSFLRHCNELFDFACKVNADSKYKWHKNLQMVENHLGRVKFHIEKSLSLIALIDAEHLDYEVQMRRLRDVHSRFQPLMNRIDGSLGNIQEELSLPITNRAAQAALNGTPGSVSTSTVPGPRATNAADAATAGRGRLALENGPANGAAQYEVEEPAEEKFADGGVSGKRFPTPANNPMQGADRCTVEELDDEPAAPAGGRVSMGGEGENEAGDAGVDGSKVCVIS
jgi:hypothetical protein